MTYPVAALLLLLLSALERLRSLTTNDCPENGYSSRHYSAAPSPSQWGLRPTLLACILLAAANSQSAPRFAFNSRAQWEAARASIRSNMQAVMGPLPDKARRSKLNVRTVADVDGGTFLRREIRYSPEPDAEVNAYLLVPYKVLRNGEKAPAVLALHPTHSLSHKVVVGLGDNPNNAYGAELASRGYVVLAPPYPLLGDYNPDLKKLGYQSGTMKAIWDNIRALDVLESLPYVKTNAFGAIGHSLGGHNALFTAAFDERIKVVATSCAFDSFRDYMNGNIRGWTSARYMPRLLNYEADKFPFDFHEVLALLAPRHCFVSAPLGDTNFKWRSVDNIAKEVWPIYRLYNAEENLQIVHPDCDHRFPPEIRDQAYRLFDKVLK